jgi:PAS domain S-box-containing protein
MNKTTDLYDYYSILENMPDGMFIVDNNRVITFWNKAAEKILGYPAEEIVGKTCDYFKSPTCLAARSLNENEKCPLFIYESIFRKRCMIKAKDGSIKYVIKHANVLKNDQGEIIGGVENIVDITEQEEAARLSHPRNQSQDITALHNMVGAHDKMRELYEMIALAKDTTASVIIYGESGTGKEMVAQAIHYLGERKDSPFIAVRCAAIAESVLESELFGHVKGAFTGAISDRKGRFEEAHGGTIFLDEIGDLPLSIQAKLLRFLQEKEITRVGDNKHIKVDARIISATHKNLNELIADGQFREDLFYRLNVIPIMVPSLRVRKNDIPLLVDHFLKKFSQEAGNAILKCDPKAMDILSSYAWPGNVRELENTIHYAMVTCKGDTIEPDNLPEQIVKYVLFDEKKAYTVDDIREKEQIKSALEMAGGKMIKAAKILGYSRVTLWKKVKQFNIDRKSF